MNNKQKRENQKEEIVKNNVDFSDRFRENLMKYTGLKNITMTRVAEESQVPINTINSFLHKVSNDMKISNVAKIAKTLNVSIDELVGTDTLHELTKESLEICRNLPENDLLLVRWFIRCLADQNRAIKPNKRFVKVMLPEEDNDGNCKLVSRFENLEITDLQEPLRSKVFIGFKIQNDSYLPYYRPNDVLLVANDRTPKSNEHVFVRVGDYIFLVKRVLENGNAKLYSVRDNKYRIDESEVSELIGYVAHIKRF